MDAKPNWVLELETLAADAAARTTARFRDETRPRLAQLIVDSGMVMARKAAGEDTRTAEIALESMVANLAVEERMHLNIEARETLLRTLVRVAGIVAGAA